MPLLAGRLSKPGWKIGAAAAEGVRTLFFRVAALLRVALVKVAILLVLPLLMEAAGCKGPVAFWERA